MIPTPLRLAALAVLLTGLAPAPSRGSEERARRVEASARISERMRELRVPAVSVAVIDDGAIAWARAWGDATPETLFQAASISKPVAATGALHMSQYGNFTLDEDVNGGLTSWQVPESPLTAERKVTLRGLLSHSAGLSVHGFPGYASGAVLPTLRQILDGKPPANTEPIRVVAPPGSEWRYSGGGYVVLQQLMMDRTGLSFPELMRRMVLGRIGMEHSSYEQPLPEALAAHAAVGHDAGGEAIPGRWHTYPEMAAAGLWTTPGDLALWAIEVWKASSGSSNRIVERSTARAMLERQRGDFGLGVHLQGEGPALRFGHRGSNAGYRCALAMVVASGDGAVIMTNGDGGEPLLDALLEAVAAEYGWPPIGESP